MSKSRVKSDQEYQEILGGITPSKENSTTPEFFDSLRENENKTIEVNPFDRIVSIGDIKEALKEDLDETNVLEIKAEIEAAQRTSDNSEDEVKKHRKDIISGENTRKLYENLRDSKLNSIEKKDVSKKEVVKLQDENKVTELDTESHPQVETDVENSVLPLEFTQKHAITNNNSATNDNIIAESLGEEIEITDDILTPKIEEPEILMSDGISLDLEDNQETKIESEEQLFDTTIQPEKLETELIDVDSKISFEDLASNNVSDDTTTHTSSFDSKKLETLAQALDAEKNESSKEVKVNEKNTRVRDYIVIAALIVAIAIVAFLLFKELSAK